MPGRTTEGDSPIAETAAASPAGAGPALTPTAFPGRVATPDQVLALQRMAGNRAVAALLQRAPADAPTAGGVAPAPPADKPVAINDPLLPHAVEWRAMIAEGQQLLQRISTVYAAWEHAQRIVAVANSVHVADAGGQLLGHFPLRTGWRLPPGVYGMDRTHTMVFHANLDMTGIRFLIADLPEEMRKTAEKSKSFRPEEWIKIDRNALPHLFDGLTLILVAEVATPATQQAAQGHVEAPLEEDVGTPRAGYGAEIDEGKGSGKVAPLPPLSAHLTGLDKQPDGGTGSFAMHINWAEVAGGDLAGASWARKPISYGWQLWKLDKVKAPDVARAEAQARRAAGARAEKVGTWDSYGQDAARRWGDVADHAQQYEQDREAAQREGRQMDELSNQLNQGMFSVEVISTLGSQIVDTVGKLFADKREREIAWDRGAGYYFVRCVAYIDPSAADAGGTWRPPSVATKLVRVQDLDSLSQEAVGEGEDRLAQQRAKIAAEQEADRLAGADPDQDAELRTLRQELDQMELALRGPANKAIRAAYEKRKAEYERAKATSPDVKHGHRDRDLEKLEREVSRLEKQLELADTRHQELGAGGVGVRRLQATLVSRITGEQYPLVLEVNAPRRGAGGTYECTVSDVTTENGGKATGSHPSDPVDAVWNACAAFAHGDGSEQYGEGSLSVRLPEDYLSADLLADVRRTHVFESKTHDWGATKKRLEELATILGIVAVVGAPELAVVGALIGGAVAAANLYERWRNDTLRPDASLISDVLSVLSALTAGTTAIGKLTLIRGPGGRFVLVATEEVGRVASTVQKFDDWLLNPASLLWGNAQVIDSVLAINAAEEAGTLSSTDARRRRASLFTTMLNTNLGLVAKLKGHPEGGKPIDDVRDRLGGGAHATLPEPHTRETGAGHGPGPIHDPAALSDAGAPVIEDSPPGGFEPEGPGPVAEPEWAPTEPPEQIDVESLPDPEAPVIEDSPPGGSEPEGPGPVAEPEWAPTEPPEQIDVESLPDPEAPSDAAPSRHAGGDEISFEEEPTGVSEDAPTGVHDDSPTGEHDAAGTRPWNVPADRLPLMDLPPGSVMYGDRGLTRVEAQGMYENAIADGSGSREVMILENMRTGERVVIQGSRASVGAEAGPWAEFLAEGGRRGPWRAVRHYHGVGGVGVTEPRHRLPSGRGGDMSGAQALAIRNRQMHVELLDIVTERGLETLYFGYDPGAERPFFVGLPRPGGVPDYHYFRTLESYHEWAEQLTGERMPEIERGAGDTTRSAGGDHDQSQDAPQGQWESPTDPDLNPLGAREGLAPTDLAPPAAKPSEHVRDLNSENAYEELIAEGLSRDELDHVLALIDQPRLEITELTPAEAANLHRAMSALTFTDAAGAQVPVPYHYTVDGCWARAHMMSQVMTAAGIASERIFATSTVAGSPLEVRSPFSPDQAGGGQPVTQWFYHVAPIVKVRTPAGVETWVIDPSTQSTAVPVKTWLASMGVAPGSYRQLTHEQLMAYLAEPHTNTGNLGFPTGERLVWTTDSYTMFPEEWSARDASRADARLALENPRLTSYALAAAVHEIAAAVRADLARPDATVASVIAAIPRGAPAARWLWQMFPRLRDEAMTRFPADAAAIDAVGNP